ncbi:hypothetical protein [Streptomyces sp. R41]|uniref:Uncharacterized protein n=1 Tax=Streptomyces sp. R41 TaxID=3238632 RepID=A0AB39RUI0_9ACTN
MAGPGRLQSAVGGLVQAREQGLQVTAPVGRRRQEGLHQVGLGPRRQGGGRGTGRFERVLTDQILAIGPVRDARSTFCIRTVIDRGPLPLNSWPAPRA